MRVLKIQIDLVCAERGPDLPGARTCVELRQERQSIRARYRGEIRLAIHHDEIIPIVGDIPQKSLEPLMMNGDMIDHGIEHQTESIAQARNVLPFANCTLDRLIIDDRKPVIGKVWEEWQHMDTADQTGKILFTKDA